MQWGIFDQGQITSLEVKNYLRMRGYFATQEQVSIAMEAVFANSKILEHAWEDNGKFYEMAVRTVTTGGKPHREYYFNEVEAEDDTATPATVTAAPTPLDPRAYISANLGKDSHELARELGISVASVRAFKANITRG